LPPVAPFRVDFLTRDDDDIPPFTGRCVVVVVLIVVVAAEEVDGRMVMTAKRGKASHSIFACVGLEFKIFSKTRSTLDLY
jgi:hypothetical protein